MSALREWLTTEFAKARAAASDARNRNAGSRRQVGRSAAALEHASATARMVALGEVLQHLDEPPARLQTEPGA